MSTSAATGYIGETYTNYNQPAVPTSAGDELGKDDFMLLLVTQFQYQDPLNPMEDKEFIAQLATFSSLEQLMNLNESMLGLTDATREQQLLGATSFIGKSVEINGTQISKEEGLEPTTYQYIFGEQVSSGTISVYQGSELVYVEDLPVKQAGTIYDFEWSGKTNAGIDAPDGIYNVLIGALNGNGESVIAQSQVVGIVKSVSSENNTIFLHLTDNTTHYLSEIRTISAAPKETTPDDGDGEVTPPDEEIIPPEGETTPPEGETTPPEGETIPPEGETTP